MRRGLGERAIIEICQIEDVFGALAYSHDLRRAQFHALIWVGLDGPLTMGEIAQRVGVSEKTITGVVDRLERDGYVQRERDAGDRRVVRVRLTPAGARTYRQVDVQVVEQTGLFLSLLDPTDRAALRRILRRLTGRLTEAVSAGKTNP